MGVLPSLPIHIWFGERQSGALRVSLYNDWIDGVTGLPEPGSLVLLLVGGAILLRRRGRA